MNSAAAPTAEQTRTRCNVLRAVSLGSAARFQAREQMTDADLYDEAGFAA